MLEHFFICRAEFEGKQFQEERLIMIQHQRLKSLIEFVREYAKNNEKTIFDLKNHPFYKHEHEICGLPGVHIQNNIDEDEIWLVVERWNPSKPPIIKEDLLRGWIALSNDPSIEPTLKTFLEQEEFKDNDVIWGNDTQDEKDVPPLILLKDFARKQDVEEQLKSYMTTEWKDWSKEEKKRRSTINLYNKLFEVKNSIDGSITNVEMELVIGVGVAVWNMDGSKVCYPLITFPLEIQTNKSSMAIEIRPQDADPSLELDIYTKAKNPGVSNIQKAFKEYLSESTTTFSPFNLDVFNGFLNLATAELDSNGEYLAAQTSPHERNLPQSSDCLKITDTWVLIAREKSKDDLVKDLERFKVTLEECENLNLPKAIHAVLTEPSPKNEDSILSSYRGLSSIPGSMGLVDNIKSTTTQNLYFPLPFNDEQVKIVQLLDASPGVVVQGPPGTGKTHTIANIISHYLAQGLRVLVTSKSAHALYVLRDKLPKEIRPLAISSLHAQHKEDKQFEFAIDKILLEVQTINSHDYKKDIEQSEQKINSLHANIADIDNQIRDLARKNLEPIIIDEKEYEPYKTAEELVAGEGIYEWLEDSLSFENKPLFNTSDIVRLRDARRAVAKDFDYLGVQLPELTSFPEINELLNTHQDLSHYNKIENEIKTGSLPRLLSADDSTFERACQLESKIDEFLQLEEKINSKEVSWAPKARNILSQKTSDTTDIIKIFDELGLEILNAAKSLNTFLARPVSIPKVVDIDDELYRAVKDKVAGKSLFGILDLIGKAKTKKQLREILIVSSPPKSMEDWQHVLSYIDLERCILNLLTRWNALANEVGVEIFSNLNKDSLYTARNHYNMHLDLRKNIEIANSIGEETRLLFPAWEKSFKHSTEYQHLHELKKHIQNYSLRKQLEKKLSNKEEILRLLSGYQGEIINSLKIFTSDVLGNPEISDYEAQREWLLLSDELNRLHGLKGFFVDFLEVTDKIQKSGGVKWAKKLRTIPPEENTDPLLPHNWKKAWRLKQIATYWESIDAMTKLQDLSMRREEYETKLAQEYTTNVEKRTWLKLYENATPDIKSALVAYKAAIAKLGKGSGKSAARYKRDARNAASAANPAVPCWIMPHSNISQILPPVFGCFDLVIIDEASQSDLSALPALLRAKKVLIVGDDKQVSPTNIGLEEENINILKKRFLKNQVDNYGEQMTPDRSIYDLFKVVFAQSTTILREHFRCASPIIEYSKREFYNHELKPIRTPKPSERLDPPLVDVFVEDGNRRPDNVNVPEARYIVNEIKRICEDKTLSKRSIGVVSLLAGKQAYKIWQDLENELGPEKIELHQISCGDASTFQGKERDIMFLSMVVSPDSKLKAISGSIYEQRFNVAASRAKDRMYLVRSIKLEDLSPNDKLRRNLLSHFANPFMQDEEQVADLRKLCESPFEEKVYDLLTERGYRVKPQVKVGAYRIDLVVEGDNDARIAIECDGDQYHTSENWDKDMHRQRILERAGWQFWRCFYSTFIKNKNDVISELLELLNQKGIEPIGSESSIRSIHTEFRSVKGLDSTNPMHLVEAEFNRLQEEENSENINGSVVEAKKALGEETKTIISAPTSHESNEPVIKKYSSVKMDDMRSNLNPVEFFHYNQSGIISDLVSRIIIEESPISLGLLAERVARAYNFKRTGNRILEYVRNIAAKQFPSHHERNNEFFWSSNEAMESYNECRTASSENENIRNVEDICQKELQSLAKFVENNTKPQNIEQHIRAMAEILGYKRITKNITQKLAQSIRLNS